MGFGKMLASLAGWMVVKTAYKDPASVEEINKRIRKNDLELGWETGLILPNADIFERMTPVWTERLNERLHRCCSALDELYHAIDYQPVDGSYGGDPPLYFVRRWPKAGVTQRNDYCKISLVGLILCCRIIPHGVDLISLNGIVPQIKKSLQVIRLQYWIPDWELFKDVQKARLKRQGVPEHEIDERVRRIRIPYNDPTSTVVHRSPEELKYFDKVSERILMICDFLQSIIIDWYRIKCGMAPSSAFYNHEGYMSWEQYNTWILTKRAT